MKNNNYYALRIIRNKLRKNKNDLTTEQELEKQAMGLLINSKLSGQGMAISKFI